MRSLVCACAVGINCFVISVSDLESRDKDGTPVHVINIDIQDNHEEATIGAFIICDLITTVRALSRCLFVCLSVCLSVFVCLTVFLHASQIKLVKMLQVLTESKPRAYPKHHSRHKQRPQSRAEAMILSRLFSLYNTPRSQG